jgi:MFS family permease
MGEAPLREQMDSREAWLATVAALLVTSVSLGAPYVVVVALKPIAEELGGFRSVPSGAMSLAMLGTGVGGLAMGWVAERVGIRAVVMFGAVMVCAGLALSSRGAVWQLYIGHGLLMGLIGNGAINAPIYIYVTKWFERRRGTALALIASGPNVAGALWPPLFERAIAAYGWRQTMVTFGLAVVGIVVPLAALFLRPPPETPKSTVAAGAAAAKARVLDLPPNAAFALLAGASFLCCIPMAMPPAHVIALCGDLGMTPAKGAAMLTVMLMCAFAARQLWGWLADRVGGPLTLLIGSLAQGVAIAGFMITQNEAGLFAVAGAFGLGFSGMIPAYILTARQLFPAHEASWRIPTLLLTGMSGMAAGSWLAGVIYDHYGFYAPAFATGLAFNVANFAIIAVLVVLWRGTLAHRTTAGVR